MQLLSAFWKCTAGASAAEYALILAVVGGLFAAAAMMLGGAISQSLNGTAQCIQDASAC